MKRMLAVLLTIAMLFALCACGSKELSAEEKERIYQEVAAEKAAAEKAMSQGSPAAEAWKQTQDAMLQPPPPQSTLAPVYDVGPSPTDTDYISIEDVKLVSMGDGQYRPNIKVRCLYPTGVLQTYPQRLMVYCNYLDSDGAIIQSFCSCFDHLSYNQAMWTKANNFSHMNGEDAFSLQDVKQLQFTWYHMRTIIGGRVSWQQEWDLLEPVVFNVADLEIEE